MKRTSKVIWGTLASGLQTLIAIALQIVLMPLILRTAGQEVLGSYAIIMQIIGYLALADLGINTALARFLSQSTDEPDRFRSLMSSGFYFLALLGGVYALLGTALAFVLGGLFHLSGPVEVQTRFALLLLAGWGLVRFPSSIYSTALFAMQDLGIPPLLGAMANAFRMVFAILAVKAGWSVVGLAAASVLSEALLAGSILIRFRQLRPIWSMRPTSFNFSVLQEPLRFGFQAFWGNLAGRVILFTDNIVVGNLYGATAAGVYYNTQTPVSVPMNLVWQLSANAAPGINDLWAKREWEKLRDVFLRLQRLTLLIVALVVIGGWFYLEPTIKIWIGPSQFGGQWLVLWLIAFAALKSASQVPLMFVFASGSIRGFSQLTTLEAAANLGLSFLLGSRLGLHGVALATLIAHVPTAIYLQARSHGDLGIPLQDWARQTLWPALRAAVPTAIMAGLLVNLVSPTSWGILVLHGAILGIIHAVSIFLLGLTVADRAVVTHTLEQSLLRMAHGVFQRYLP